jgi:LemA protein
MVTFVSGAAIFALLALWFIRIYNKLVRNRNLVEEGWSGIDVQLKKRADLVPNLVETVKGYVGHERELLENVTKYRVQAQQAQDMEGKSKAEGLLSQALGRLFAVAEAYPDLKANQNFVELQHALAEIEGSIEMSRRYYNGCVRNMNILVESFPSNIVASTFRFSKADFFEMEEPAERIVPEVRF